mmetsp:Transcript_24672/g.77073  ORF Transcript_24672/g.77073 Transcript_24672/m.77073 type:complete len:87 (+) Transcript_24672:669-929(+)
MLTALGSRPWDWQNLMALLGSRRRDANDELPTAVVVADEESPADNLSWMRGPTKTRTFSECEYSDADPEAEKFASELLSYPDPERV